MCVRNSLYIQEINKNKGEVTKVTQEFLRSSEKKGKNGIYTVYILNLCVPMFLCILFAEKILVKEIIFEGQALNNKLRFQEVKVQRQKKYVKILANSSA